jgi:DNA-binding NarL/FixJ family response regulator
MDDCANENIADTIGISERTVRRIVKRLNTTRKPTFIGAD